LGENYALRYAASSRGFRLLEELEAITPTRRDKESRGYSAVNSPLIKRDQLAYFALSVFWRAAVHRWPEAEGNGRTEKIGLGAENTETLRQFLVGEQPLPLTMSLFLVVLTDELSQATVYLPPPTSKKNFCWGYGFFACGYMFNLFVGRKLDHVRTGSCLTKSPERWIWVRDGEAKTLGAIRSLLAKQPPDVRLK
jgi:hypothetical protein